MHLGDPKSAIISAIIFNALIIPALIPLALKGVKYRAIGATALLRRNLGDLRARRRDPPVHRDQAHRPDRAQPPRSVSLRPGPLPDPARHGRGRRQDLPDAPGGAAGASTRAATSSSATSSRTSGRRRRRSPRGSRSCRACAPSTAGSSSRRWTSTRSSGARPELALVDELAHTNAPGMRNEKRYQDIDEILDAGIDVISTVNVQHLESLNDASRRAHRACASARRSPTGSSRRRTRSCSSTSTPEALQQRLRAGQGLRARARPRRRSTTSSGSRTSSRAARARPARGRRGRRGAPAERTCSTR